MVPAASIKNPATDTSQRNEHSNHKRVDILNFEQFGIFKCVTSNLREVGGHSGEARPKPISNLEVNLSSDMASTESNFGKTCTLLTI